jgi:hypothetical protein
MTPVATAALEGASPNYARVLAAQLALNGARRRNQISPSTFTVVKDEQGRPWLREDYQVLDRHLCKDDLTDWLGPFTPTEWAQLNLSAVTA